MKRSILLGLLLAVVAVAGCQSADKNDVVGAADSRWKVPAFLYKDDFFARGELGDVVDP